MEPRPQSSRSAHGQPASRQPAAGAGRGPEETASYQPQHDPSTVVAPPRTDYDYSPLDLAPPGQRRRRQLVAAGLGMLVMGLLVAAIVFAFLVLREDDGDDLDIAAVQTQTAAELATQQASTPDPTTNPDGAAEGAPDVAGAVGDIAPPATTAAAGEQPAAQPTQPPAQTAGGPTEADLQAMLPGPELMPVGLDQQADSALTKEEVVAALGGSREAETNLTNWGWTANVQRIFTAADPAVLAPDATTDITVSLHGFGSDQAAAEALTFYSDVLLNGGYQEVEVGDIGAANRMLIQPQADGGTTVALYVQQGPVLYRIGGYAPAGDPTQNVINLAQAMIGQPVATGQ